MRTLGLLTELSAAFEVELLVLVREPLRDDQRAALAMVSARVTEIPLRDATVSQRLLAALWGGGDWAAVPLRGRRIVAPRPP